MFLFILLGVQMHICTRKSSGTAELFTKLTYSPSIRQPEVMNK